MPTRSDATTIGVAQSIKTKLKALKECMGCEDWDDFFEKVIRIVQNSNAMLFSSVSTNFLDISKGQLYVFCEFENRPLSIIVYSFDEGFKVVKVPFFGKVTPDFIKYYGVPVVGGAGIVPYSSYRFIDAITEFLNEEMSNIVRSSFITLKYSDNYLKYETELSFVHLQEKKYKIEELIMELDRKKWQKFLHSYIQLVSTFCYDMISFSDFVSKLRQEQKEITLSPVTMFNLLTKDYQYILLGNMKHTIAIEKSDEHTQRLFNILWDQASEDVKSKVDAYMKIMLNIDTEQQQDGPITSTSITTYCEGGEKDIPEGGVSRGGFE